MNIAGKEVPTPAVALGGGAALYFVYRWYKNRGTSSTAGPSTGALTGTPGPRGTTGPPGPPGPGANPATTNWLQAQVNDLYRNVRNLNKAEAKEGRKAKPKGKPAAQPKLPGAAQTSKGRLPEPGPGKRPVKTAMVPTRGAA